MNGPDGWPSPPVKMLDRARSISIRALSDDEAHPATQRLIRYYDPQGDYAGVSFVQMEPTAPNDIGIADLHALTLLNVRVGPRATRRLLAGGDQLGGYRREIIACLSKVAPDKSLAEAGSKLLTEMSDLYRAVIRALSDPTTASSNPWVTAAKLCSRKRPNAFPVRDNVVCTHLGLLGKGVRGDHRVDLLVFQQLLNDDDVADAIDNLGERVRSAGISPDGGRLKLLDAALWTHATWET